MKKTVAIIFGGESSEYEVSCVSAANVAENVDKNIYDVILVGITKDGKWWIYRGSTDDLRNHIWQEKRALLIPAVISPCKAHHGLIALDGANGSFDVPQKRQRYLCKLRTYRNLRPCKHDERRYDDGR